MNLATVNVAYKVARSLWEKLDDSRQEKARAAYSSLADAAHTVQDDAEDLLPQARREAGEVTKAAHARLERALADLSERGEEAKEGLVDRVAAARKEAARTVKQAKKAGKKQVKSARKEAKKSRKAAQKQAKALARKQDKGKFWPIFRVLALLLALGGVAFYLVRNVFVKETPSENPPRVENFSGSNPESSTLVYTSTSESTPEEGVTERDEELLDSLDEQLAKHRDED